MSTAVCGAHALANHQRAPALIGVVAGIIGLVWISDSKATGLALFLAAIFMAAQVGRRRLALAGLAMLALAFVVTVVAVDQGWLFLIGGKEIDPIRDQPASNLANSVLSRLRLWSSSVVAISHAPFFGFGFGSFEYVFPSYVLSYQDAVPQLGASQIDVITTQVGAVHNELLQTLFELGMLGLLLAVTIVVLALKCAQRFKGGHPSSFYGLALAALIGTGLIGFPFQFPKTAISGALILGAIATRSGESHQEPIWTPLSNVIRYGLFIAIMLIAGIALWTSVLDLLAHRYFERANALQFGAQQAAAYEAVTQAAAISGVDPRIRGRLFPQLMATGPDYFGRLDPARIEEIYQVTRSALPTHPITLDMRLKYLLLSQMDEADLRQFEKELDPFKRIAGRGAPNPHILEAAIALSLGDHERAANALAAARSFESNDPSIKQNIVTLTRRLNQSSQPRPPEISPRPSR